jgi:heme A synthase
LFAAVFVLGCLAGRRVGNPVSMNATVLWILAVILVVVGIVQVLQGQLLLGIVLLIAAALVGPGGYSVFSRRA